MRLLRIASAAVLCAAAFFTGTAPASAAERCVRTADSGPYWEVCAGRGDCLVYVWSTMPPAICA